MVEEIRVVVLLDAEHGLRVQANCPVQQSIAYLEMALHLLLTREVGAPRTIKAGDRASIVQAPLAGRQVGR